MLFENDLRTYYLTNVNRFQIIEGLLYENPNQAIKFLKEKNLDPQTSEEGKKILNSITNITRGDGYTNILTKFLVNEKMPLEDISKLHDYLVINKQHINRLPKPVVTYDNYRELKRDIDSMEEMRGLKKLYNELTPELKKQTNNLNSIDKQKMKELANKFLKLKPDQQKFFTAKVTGYSNISEFITNLDNYITQIESGETQEIIRKKINDTENAYVVYDDPEKNIIIAHIDSFDASKKLGCTSNWCITRDTSYWRQYKKGGNKYFFIWDFNYPPNNNNYLIGTAYNQSNPERSQTHLKDDVQAKFQDVINLKNLNYDIFNKYIEEYQKEYLKKYESSVGLLKAISEYSKTNNSDDLINIIKQSEIVNTYSSPDVVDVSYGDINLGIDEEEMKDIFDLDDSYDNILSYGNGNYYHDSADYEELDYMVYPINNDNKNKIREIADLLGYDNKYINSLFENDGDLRTFFEDNNMRMVIDNYLSEYGNAEAEAKSSIAKEMLDTIPFNIESGSISIQRMIDYIKENNLNINNFDQFVEYVKDNHDEFNIENIYEYNSEMDFDQLNSQMEYDLDDILNNIEDYTSEEVVEEKNKIFELKNNLLKIGFTIVGDSNLYAYKKQNDKEILIKKMYLDDDIAKVLVEFQYVDGNVRKGSITVDKIFNYIDQYEIPNFEE